MNDWTQYAKVPTPIYKKNKYIPKSPNIVSGLLQQQLINKVKELINFNKIKYYVLHTKQDLQRLTKEFFVSPKINGIPCIFMATTIDGSFYTFTFSINDYLSNNPDTIFGDFGIYLFFLYIGVGTLAYCVQSFII